MTDDNERPWLALVARAHHATVRCAQCRKPVLAERAAKTETDEYVRHFCGLTCLSAWQAQGASD